MFSQHCEFYPPAGQGLALEIDPEDGADIRAHIYEPTAVQHVENGVFKDFSVGWYDPEYVVDRQAPNGRMVGGWAREVSLVDDGANKNAAIKGFVVAKSKRKGIPPQLYGVAGALRLPAARDVDAAEETMTAESGDRITRALKEAMMTRSAKALASAHWYAAFKRNFDPNVGGGVDRDKLPDSDFVIIDGSGDSKDRKFPIVTPGDVSDAVSSWGRYKGPTSFDDFKAKLIAMAKKKGPSFVAELPQNWKDEMDSKKARKPKLPAEKQHPEGGASSDKPVSDDDLPPNEVECPTCHGTGKIDDGHRKCPDCQGKGHVPASWVHDGKVTRPDGKAKAPKQDLEPLAELDDLDDDDEDDDPDEDVDEAIGDLMDDLGEVAQAQEADQAMGADKPTDDTVDSAIGDTAQAIGELAAAQAEDEAAGEPGDKAKKPKKPKPAAEAAGVKAGKSKAAKQLDEGVKPPKEGKPHSVAKGKKPPVEHDPDNPECKCMACKANRKAARAEAKASRAAARMAARKAARKAARRAKVVARKARRAEKRRRVPVAALAAHDALCPAIPMSHDEAERALKGISPTWFAGRHEAVRREGAAAKQIREAYEALANATKVSLLPLPTFEHARAAAQKQFQSAYPDLAQAGFTLRSPEQFKRPFLPSATPDTPTGGFALPLPDMAPTFGPGDFDRMTQIPNEARPSPTGGTSATEMLGKTRKASRRALKRQKRKLPKGARTFYTNAAKDEASAALSQLHDYLAKTFPNICPMHPAGGSDEGEAHGPAADVKQGKHDTDHDVGLAGTQPANAVPHPVELPVPSSSDSGTIKPSHSQGADKAKAPKKRRAAKAKAGNGGARRLKRELQRARKSLKSQKASQKRFEKRISAQLRKPDPRVRAKRGPGSNFAPVVAAKQDEMTALRGVADELRARIRSRNSNTAAEAYQEAVRLGIAPERVAAMLTATE